MSGRYRWGLVAALVLQLGLLGWIIADRALLLQNGREVRFDVLPIDPRDLFLGDYVVLLYDFSRVHNGRVDGEDAFNLHDTIFVSLREGDESWEALALSREPPAEGTFLRGVVTYANVVSEEAGDMCSAVAGCVAYDIDYNLERFYVPEGTGREIEDLRNADLVSVDVAIAADGRAALKRLLVDGKVQFEEPLY